MALHIKKKEMICLLCGEEIKKGEPLFLLRPAKTVDSNIKWSHRNGKKSDECYDIHRQGGSNTKFLMHHHCTTYMLFKQEYPELDIDKIYYEHLRIATHKGNRCWKLGKHPILEPTQENLDKALSQLASDLLRGEKHGPERY